MKIKSFLIVASLLPISSLAIAEHPSINTDIPYVFTIKAQGDTNPDNIVTILPTVLTKVKRDDALDLYMVKLSTKQQHDINNSIMNMLEQFKKDNTPAGPDSQNYINCASGKHSLLNMFKDPLTYEPSTPKFNLQIDVRDTKNQSIDNQSLYGVSVQQYIRIKNGDHITFYNPPHSEYAINKPYISSIKEILEPIAPSWDGIDGSSCKLIFSMNPA